MTPGAESPLVWFGLLVVRTGIFYGGLFRFTITIHEDFPDTNEVPVNFYFPKKNVFIFLDCSIRRTIISPTYQSKD